MRLFNQVVTARGGDHLAVLHTVEHGKLAHGRTITPELVGVDDLWHVVLTEQSSDERSSCLDITVFLKENVQHGSMFIHGSPQPVFDPADVHVHFVQVTPGTPSGFPVS